MVKIHSDHRGVISQGYYSFDRAYNIAYRVVAGNTRCRLRHVGVNENVYEFLLERRQKQHIKNTKDDDFTGQFETNTSY